MDAPFEYQVIASQYQYTGNLDPGAVNYQGKSLLGILVTFAIKDPGFVAGFIASHFSATMVDSVMALPLLARCVRRGSLDLARTAAESLRTMGAQGEAVLRDLASLGNPAAAAVASEALQRGPDGRDRS